MKILITGGQGQLGQDVSKLLGHEHKVISCGSKELDISSQEAVDRVINRHHPQVLINCAAYTAVDTCEKEKELAWQVNARGPENLARGMEARDGRLIHISTDYVFDGNKPIPEGYTEEDAVAPLSQYGRSKLAGEQAVTEISSDHLILRTAWLYGWGGKNFLKTMLRLALADPSRELKVVNDQHGSLTWTATLARQIETVLTSDLQGIVHATAEGSSTWYQGACYFLDAMEISHNLVPCSTSEYPTPAHRPANSILENRRLKQAGLSIFNSWQGDIDAFVRLYRKELLQEAKG
ncbi:MAG: dTDP-4-dehydrorhamnose reductase [Proteobacteria bacterium]|nr:dTDP-4-dehydrorhamnose reductase [Pseudomonadota bacterium]